MEHYDGGSVRFGNNELRRDNAYWVEGLKHNLLSLAQLNNIRFKVEFRNGKAKLLDRNGYLVGSNKQIKGQLFYPDLSESSCFIVIYTILSSLLLES